MYGLGCSIFVSVEFDITLSIIHNLYQLPFHRKLLASTFSSGFAGLKAIFLRLLALPIAMCFLWIFYRDISVNIAKNILLGQTYLNKLCIFSIG